MPISNVLVNRHWQKSAHFFLINIRISVLLILHQFLTLSICYCFKDYFLSILATFIDPTYYYYYSHLCASIAWIGVDGFTLCPNQFFFILSFLSLFLALLHADPAVVELVFSYNKQTKK